MDPKIHQEYVGVDNRLILANLKKLSESGKEVIVRIPIVPGFNDTTGEVRAIADYVTFLGIRELHLLPFHHFGKGKYRLLDRDYPFQERKVPGKDKIEAIQKIAASEGLKVVTGG